MNSKLLPHGKGKLFKGNRLLFRGHFYEGKVELRDIVKNIKDDKKVFAFCKMLGYEAIHMTRHRLRSVCERGSPSTIPSPIPLFLSMHKPHTAFIHMKNTARCANVGSSERKMLKTAASNALKFFVSSKILLSKERKTEKEVTCLKLSDVGWEMEDILWIIATNGEIIYTFLE